MEFPVILELINVALLLFLLSVYIQNYRQMKSTFCSGLIVFAFLLLLQNIFAAYFHFVQLDFYTAEAMQHAILVSGAQTAGLLALAWVTWRE